MIGLDDETNSQKFCTVFHKSLIRSCIWESFLFGFSMTTFFHKLFGLFAGCALADDRLRASRINFSTNHYPRVSYTLPTYAQLSLLPTYSLQMQQGLSVALLRLTKLLRKIVFRGVKTLLVVYLCIYQRDLHNFFIVQLLDLCGI